MPRYFFHVHDGRSALDSDGTELPDRESACVEAIRLAGSLLRDDAAHLALGEAWRLEVADERGTGLYRVDIQASAIDGP
ncbi:hypothetical protein Q8W71_12550 [Methylobacterium sp. NEAU 140]|uniref:DUF6894 family protein n=1 Tax=Methylobacterium sp. NEAU 140 TaxID=3064945 RepID=UPI002734444C|nr:hypothetical protein [Methylobacterium sp. NEAU 140]MDP4023460.1 hypothetical protein [Methylobacterium sp. NEAU 140]